MYARIVCDSCRGVAQPGSAPALGAGGPEFKSRRPDQSFLRLTGISKKSFPSLWGKFRGPYCNIPSFSSSCCIFTTASCIFTARYFSSFTTASTL
jgi:hypothetical protein